jgi:hypothetical protein
VRQQGDRRDEAREIQDEMKPGRQDAIKPGLDALHMGSTVAVEGDDGRACGYAGDVGLAAGVDARDVGAAAFYVSKDEAERTCTRWDEGGMRAG